ATELEAIAAGESERGRRRRALLAIAVAAAAVAVPLAARATRPAPAAPSSPLAVATPPSPPPVPEAPAALVWTPSASPEEIHAFRVVEHISLVAFAGGWGGRAPAKIGAVAALPWDAVAIGTEDGRVLELSLATGAIRRELRGPGSPKTAVKGMAYAPAKKKLFWGDHRGHLEALELFESALGGAIEILDESDPLGGVDRLSASADGERFATTGPALVRLWPRRDGQPGWQALDVARPFGVAFAAADRRLLVGTASGEVYRTDEEGHAPELIASGAKQVLAVALSADGGLALWAEDRGAERSAVLSWDGVHRRELDVMPQGVTQLLLDAEGEQVVAAVRGGRIALIPLGG